MEGASNGYGSYFAPANFNEEENCDLSSEFSNSVDYVSMSAIIENLSNYVLNCIEDEFILKNINKDDDTNEIKSRFNVIKKKLSMLGAAGHLQQLEAFIKPDNENPLLIKVKNVANSLKSEYFNGFSNEVLNDINIDISGCDFFSENFGVELETFRDILKNICKEYEKSYITLFDLDDELHISIEKFTKLTKQIDNTLSLDINEASLEVFKAFTKYLTIFFKEQNIKEKFDNFILARKKFVTYRDLIFTCKKVIDKTDDITESPICTICIHNHVKTAFVPCGHTFCLVCANKTINECYICRTKINSRLKLYFS